MKAVYRLYWRGHWIVVPITGACLYLSENDKIGVTTVFELRTQRRLWGYYLKKQCND